MKPVKLNKKESAGENEEPRIAESFLEGIPFIGGFIKELAKTDTFKERFKEANEKIEENLKKGGKKEWVVESRLSVRPIIGEAKKDTKKDASELYIGKEHMYTKRKGALGLAVKVPNEDVALIIKGKRLLITSPNFKKELELPDEFRTIKKKKYKNGVLMLELTK